MCLKIDKTFDKKKSKELVRKKFYSAAANVRLVQQTAKALQLRPAKRGQSEKTGRIGRRAS